MKTAEESINETHPRLAELVEAAKLTTGSQMRAYEMVAGRIGATPEWVRKLVGRRPGVALASHIKENIMAAHAAYEETCARLERQAAAKREAFFAAEKAGAVYQSSHEPRGLVVVVEHSGNAPATGAANFGWR